MKTINFNIQAKGGSGKSMLTYLQALKHESNESVLFVDLDSSTKTSTQQLNFLRNRTPFRLVDLDLLDDRSKIVRDKLIKQLEKLVSFNYNSYYLDFGTPESEQLPALIGQDFSAREFLQLSKHLDARFVFNVVMAGGTAFLSCTKYLSKVDEVLRQCFSVNIWLNEYTFYNFKPSIEEVNNYAAERSTYMSVRLFGDFDTETETGKGIIEKIANGSNEFEFIQNLKIANELKKI